MNYAVILASGTGSRAKTDIPKQFIKVKGKTLIEYTIEKFQNNKMTDKIILVVLDEYLEFCKNLKYDKIQKVIKGGKKRQDSSRLGVMEIKEENAKVLIHDGARPFIKDKIINDCYLALDKYNAINTGVETQDTIIEIDKDNFIKRTLKRNTLRRCQTPQGFKASLIKKAHLLAQEKNLDFTDDCGLITELNLDRVYVVEGDIENIKITYENEIKTLNEKL